MPKASKISSFFAKLSRFLKVQAWAQKLRFKALGRWYFVELADMLMDRIYPILNSFITAYIINEVIRLATAPVKDLHFTLQLIVIQQTFSLFKRALSFIHDRNFSVKIQRPFTFYIENQIISKLIDLNWEHIENPATEKDLNMTSNRAMYFLETTISTQIDVLAITTGAILAFNLGNVPWFIILIVLVRSIPGMLLSISTQKRIYEHTDQRMKEGMQIGWIMSYFRDFKMILEMKLARAAETVRNIRNKLIALTTKELDRALNKTTTFSFITMVFEILTSTGISLYYLSKVIFENMQIGTFNFTTSAVFNVGDSFSRVLSQLSRLTDGYRYIRHAYQLLHLENKRKNGQIKLDTAKIQIEFQNVWFRYPVTKKWALKNVSFTIEDNARIAIVGENGAGKSTFLKLLMLGYYPTKGKILINGIPVDQYDRDSIHERLALVSQDFSRYDAFDITQNIALFGDLNNIDTDRLKHAAEYANASEFIEKLPLKYNTILSKRFEGGTELSTGQWQRIAVARQFYANRPIVVLDEPTASIDPIAEAKIFTNLYEHVKDKTVIVVSHRYNTVRAAKKILVFKDGEIIEQGNHESLMAQNGYYASAYSVQQEEKKL